MPAIPPCFNCSSIFIKADPTDDIAQYRRVIETTVETICNIIETDDAQEGLAAFNEKRAPRW